MDKTLKHHADWKKSSPKGVYTVPLYLYKVLKQAKLIYHLKKKIRIAVASKVMGAGTGLEGT